MRICGFQIKNILKTYYKNIRWGEKKAERREERYHGRDKVEISVEGRKKKICQKAADQVIQRLTTPKNTPTSFPEESQ